MSANAASWFYSEPERNAFFITERLNGTFWQARIVGLYWRCTQPEPPYRAQGFMGEHMVELEWTPGQWVALKVPPGVEAGELVAQISRRILAMPASITYGDTEGRKVTEWHADGGKRRWGEIQGRAEFTQPRRLKRK
jgi:hypothetical protein